MIKEIVAQDIRDCLQELKIEPKKVLVLDADPKFGDYSSNVAMVHAKSEKMPIEDLAKKMVLQLSKSDYYKKVEVAKGGFINFVLDDKIYYDAILGVDKSKFEGLDYGKGQKVLVEFVSANPTGPLNIVSARAASYGDTLCAVMNFIGYKATKEFYINDYGNQIDILSESIEIRYKEVISGVTHEFPLEGYHGEYVKDIAKKIVEIDGTKLLSFSNEDRDRRIKKFALYEMLKSQKKSLKAFRVDFDNWVSEKSLRDDNMVEEALSYLSEAGYTYERDEAVWFKSTLFGDEKDRILMKSDGNTTYFVPDIGYHINKYQRGYDVLIDVLGPDHHGYIKRMWAAIKAIGYPAEKLEFVILQQVNLFDGKEQVKMSKREGKIVKMDDLIKEVGTDAARFFFLDRKTTSHLNFDMELAKKRSNDNPVYYCQYAHARIASLVKKAKKEKLTLTKFKPKQMELLKGKQELILMKKILQFPETLALVASSREPNKLTNYTSELAGMYHKYYGSSKMINLDNPDLTVARLFLSSCVKMTLGKALSLMGITAPEKM